MCRLWSDTARTLTTSVQPIDAGDIIRAHLGGVAEGHAGIALRDDGWLAVFGEGSA